MLHTCILMIKNCALNEKALAVLDPIRDQITGSYSDAVISLAEQNHKTDAERIAEAFTPFRDTVLGTMGGDPTTWNFLEIVQITTLKWTRKQVTPDAMQKIIEFVERELIDKNQTQEVK